jgi:hypothetical protein
MRLNPNVDAAVVGGGKGIRCCSVDYRLREFRLFAVCPESGNYRLSNAPDLTIAIVLAITCSGTFTCPDTQRVVGRLEACGLFVFPEGSWGITSRPQGDLSASRS